MNELEKERIIEVVGLWSNIADLASYAVKRHGFGDSDGGFGITYPSDLDDHEEHSIPEGYIEVYGFWGNPDGYEFRVRESDYLEVLSHELAKSGFTIESEIIATQLLSPEARLYSQAAPPSSLLNPYPHQAKQLKR